MSRKLVDELWIATATIHVVHLPGDGMHKSMFLLAVALSFGGLRARAETLDFNLTANNTAECGYMPANCLTSVLNFQIAQSPVPSSFNSNTFTLNDAQIIENTLPYLTTPLPITFSVQGIAPGGGFALGDDIYGMFSFDFPTSFGNGPLFSGSIAAPTFNVGSYSAVTYLGAGYNGALTITEVAETPEPSSIFLLGSGLLGIVGVVGRRRRQIT